MMRKVNIFVAFRMALTQTMWYICKCDSPAIVNDGPHHDYFGAETSPPGVQIHCKIKTGALVARIVGGLLEKAEIRHH